MNSEFVFYKHYYPTNSSVPLETLEKVWSYISKKPLPKWDDLTDTSNFLSHVKSELLLFHNEEWHGTVDFYGKEDAEELIQFYTNEYNKLISDKFDKLISEPIKIKLYACRVNELNDKFNKTLCLFKDDDLRNYVNTSVRNARLKFIGDVPEIPYNEFFGHILKLQMNHRLVEDIKSVRLFPRNLITRYDDFIKELRKIHKKSSRSMYDETPINFVYNDVDSFIELYRNIGTSIEIFFSYSFMRELTNHDEIPFIIPEYMSEEEILPKNVEFDLNFDLNDFYKFIIALLKLKKESSDFYDSVVEINKYSHIFKYNQMTNHKYI